jgi:type VI secretion system protein ImpG
MDDQLLKYYERELTFIREMASEFGRKYPKIAGRLLLEQEKSADPHTERLIEAFALISGRIHKKIEDGFPEITESLLGILYPHYIRPIPSASIVRFDPILQNIPPSGYLIEKGTNLHSKPVGGTPCQFTTAYPVTLWPIQVISAGFQDPKIQVKGARQAIRIRLKTSNQISVSNLGWENLRFFLNGPSQQIFNLYELLLNNVCHIELEGKTPGKKVHHFPLNSEDITPVGFDRGEGLIPFPERSFPGYLLLSDYFCFPEKFLFLDVEHLSGLRNVRLGEELDIWIYLDKVAKPHMVVDERTFCLNAAPAVNLFKRIAEPIRVEQRKTDYRVVPDIRRLEATEVFNIDRVTAASNSTPGGYFEFRPFYSIRHHLEEEQEDRRAFWHSHRRPSGRKDDDGTEVYLSFTDLGLKPHDPGVEIVTVHLTCTNRDLPSRLPFGDPEGDFDMEMAAPVSKISSLIRPTPARRPSLGRDLQWRLISHLSLNHLSIIEGGEESLKEILRLYDLDQSPSTRQQIEGILSLQSQPVTKRVGPSFCRGVRVTIGFDEEKFVGAGLFLFASVLERFLATYVSVNSFSQMVAKTLQRKEMLKEWPPRSGNRILL